MSKVYIKDPLSKRNKQIEAILDNHGCYICTSHSKCSNGRYYNIKRNNKVMLLHRYIYETYYGKIEEDLVVRHKCDNVLCINPNHLEIGYQKDNANDMVSRNRSTKGVKNGRAKLTQEDVNRIREMKRNNVKQRDIARIFNISESLVSQIIHNVIW